MGDSGRLKIKNLHEKSTPKSFLHLIQNNIEFQQTMISKVTFRVFGVDSIINLK